MFDLKGALVLLTLGLAVACVEVPIGTPRPQDASAPRDFYRALGASKSKCEPAVPILNADEVGGRKYRELRALSATCYPGAPGACRRTLSDRACELEADALILNEPSSRGETPPGASGQSVIAISARAVNWQ